MRTLNALLVAALLSPSLHALAADDLESLRTENARLKARIQSLEASCPAAATSSSGPAAAVVAPPSPATTAAGTSAVPAPSVPAATVLPTPPPGYRLVREPEPYTETGCTSGLFTNSGDALWKHEDAWNSLQRGMKPAEVERLLGIDHYNLKGGDRIQWQYGKCHDFVQGYVLFVGGAVQLWKTPDW